MRAFLILLIVALVLALYCVVGARTLHVPSEYTTIRSGINAADYGDTVLIACGTYYEYDISMYYPHDGICVRSETGSPDCVTIDGHGGGRPVFSLGDYIGRETRFEGLTITGGTWHSGAGFFCYPAHPTVSNCVFTDNHVSHYGGAMLCAKSHPAVVGCVFSNNSSGYVGGAIEFAGRPASAELTDCVFVNNSAPSGGAVHAQGNSSPTFTRCTFFGNSATEAGAGVYASWTASQPFLYNCIIAFSPEGDAVHCSHEGSVVLECCDIYGNTGGDWVGCISHQYGVNGNFSECPLFCGPANDDFRLQECSPCAPGNHPHGYECGLIGAYGVGCECGLPSKVQPTTWSSLKALYR